MRPWPLRILLSAPPAVQESYAVFSPDEREGLAAYYFDSDGEFNCLGFEGPDGKVTQYADPERAYALRVLEDWIISSGNMPARVPPSVLVPESAIGFWTDGGRYNFF